MPLERQMCALIAVYQEDSLFISYLPCLFNFSLVVFLMQKINAWSASETAGSGSGDHVPCSLPAAELSVSIPDVL